MSLAPSHLLRAAIFAYGLPLVGIVIALAIASIMNQALDDQLAMHLQSADWSLAVYWVGTF